MQELIERYIYDVVRRLPENEREEVTQELRANIYDMLPEAPSEEEVKEVLYHLGAPIDLAEKYRQTPRYLISPTVFDDYLRVLKLVLPIVGVVLLLLGVCLGAFGAMQAGSGEAELGYLIGESLGNGISMAISGAFQAAVWITVGFAIYDYTRDKNKTREKKWSIEDLPPVKEKAQKGSISFSESIVEIILTIIFAALGILFCSGIFSFPVLIQYNGMRVHSIFSQEFLLLCIPAILILTCTSLAKGIVKLNARRWSIPLLIVTVINALTSMVVSVYMLTRPNIFSGEFIEFLNGMNLEGFEFFRFFTEHGINPILLLITTIIVICALIECGVAIYKTIKEKRIA